MDVGKIVRKAIHKFADAIDGAQERLSHDRLFEACSSTTPSVIGMYSLSFVLIIYYTVHWSFIFQYIPNNIHTVPSLGYLFEFYMSFASSWTGNKKWLSLCHHLPEGQAMTDDIQLQLKSQHGTRFIGWLLLHVMNTGNKGKMQMFYITFCAHFFGLSRQGIELLSKYGYGVTMDMFDDIRKMYTDRSVSANRYVNICLLNDECSMYRCSVSLMYTYIQYNFFFMTFSKTFSKS